MEGQPLEMCEEIFGCFIAVLAMLYISNSVEEGDTSGRGRTSDWEGKLQRAELQLRGSC